MKATSAARFAISLLVLAACAPCRADTRVSHGGKAGKAPDTVNAFIVLEKKGGAGSAAPLDGVELAIHEMHLPSAAGLMGWTDFGRTSSGKTSLGSDNRFGFELLDQGDVAADGSVRAYKLSIEGVSATGGTSYTVSFLVSDLGSREGGEVIQPALFAALKAVSSSGKRSGQVRVLAAKFQKGRFTYKLAVK